MQNPLAERASILFLQAVTVLVGIGALAFLLYEPNIEGVNASAVTFADVYLDDPFLAYVYVGSVAFFVALFRVFTLLRLTTLGRVFSPDALRALRSIKTCGMTLGAFVLGAAFFLFVIERGKSDDIAGGVAMCVFAMLVSGVIVAVATVGERVVGGGRKC